MSTTVRQRVRPVAEDASVTALELFFDLVFVYALTQVTALMANEAASGSTVSGRTVLQGLIVLALVWWCWVGYSWLGNNLQADEGLTRAGFLVVMAAMLVAALAIPDAFGAIPGEGISGAMVVAACYAVVRVAHIGLFAIGARSGADRGLLMQLARFGAVMLVSIALIVTGAALGGDAQIGFWLAAIAVDYVRDPGDWGDRLAASVRQALR